MNITIEANQKITNFLDITLNLNNSTYRPYMKESNTPLYVHKMSNHPPAIINNIPEAINRRLSAISSNESVFNETSGPYQQALTNSGYQYKLKFNPADNTSDNRAKPSRNRKRNITWFNPPFSNNVKTNIAKKFLGLIDSCFPKDNPLHKIFNHNTIKVSYSCMPNMSRIISSHNRNIIIKSTPDKTPLPTCNCRRKNECPLEGKCLSSGVVYQAIVTRNDNSKQESYIGLTENSFKTRYNGHNSSFRIQSKRNATTLSSYIWSLKDNSINYSIKWKIVGKANPYSTSTKLCNLCLMEKYFIICRPQLATLNNRNELASDCRHRKKHLLSH